MDFQDFPSYTEISGVIDEGVEVNLPSGKNFSYQQGTPGIPGRYRSLGARTELDAGGLLFSSSDPIKVHESDVPGTDDQGEQVLNKDIKYSIEIKSLDSAI